MRCGKPQVVSVTFLHWFADDDHLLFAWVRLPWLDQAIAEFPVVRAILKWLKLSQYCREYFLDYLGLRR